MRESYRTWKLIFDESLFNKNLKNMALNSTKFCYLVDIILNILILIKLYKIKNKRFDTQN